MGPSASPEDFPTLAPDLRIGNFQIIEMIGRGGMGEVWKARDTRLNRTVAIKTSPQHFSERFEREARAIAALNHPNICTIYDSGPGYLAMEYIDGTPIRGPLPIRKLLDLAAQVADGLAAAHAAGFVHRDLKPANILITRDGRAKILDFGLAKNTGGALPLSGDTITTQLTVEGAIVGTLHYMSPEQLRGRELDGRSDVFSFGVVLHQLLSGRQPFMRDTSADTLSAILTDDPPDLGLEVPSTLRQIVARCLEKNPGDRFQSAKDLAFALRSLQGSSSSHGILPAPVKQERNYVRPALAVASLVAAFLCGGWWLTGESWRFPVQRHTPIGTDTTNNATPILSPDGQTIAYAARVDGIRQIFNRRIDQPVSVQATHMQNDCTPIGWTPDGGRIHFVEDVRSLESKLVSRRVWTTSLAGGEPERVAPDILFRVERAVAISPDEKALVFLDDVPRGDRRKRELYVSAPPGAAPRLYQPAFSSDFAASLSGLRFTADGGQLLLWFLNENDVAPKVWLFPWPENRSGAKRILNLLNTPDMTFAPSWLPGGRHVLFNRSGHLWLADTRGDELVRVTDGSGNETAPFVSPDGGHAVYTRSTSEYDLVSVPLDGSHPTKLSSNDHQVSAPAWSRNGALAYVTRRNGDYEIWLKNRTDQAAHPLITPKDFGSQAGGILTGLEFSPDGMRLAFAKVGRESQFIWICSLNGGAPVRLTDQRRWEGSPGWSPDGSAIAFRTSQPGEQGTWTAKVGSSEPPARIVDQGWGVAAAWSPDGKWITVPMQEGLGLVSPDGKQSRLLSRHFRRSRNSAATWSRDGASLFLTWLDDRHRQTLWSLNPTSGVEREIASYDLDTVFDTVVGTNLKLSLSPDGRSLATSVSRVTGELFLMTGLPEPRSFWQRLFRMR